MEKQNIQVISLHTPRLVIRQFCAADAEPLFRLLAAPRVHCFAGEMLASMEQARQEVEKKSRVDDGSELAVCLQDGGAFIGTLFGCWEDDTFSACWNFLPEYGGKGYALEAATAYLELLFTRLNARRIYAYVEDDNTRSQRLCEKLGMRLEGLFKEYISFVNNPDGSPHYEDTRQYAILRKEWRSKTAP